MPKLADIKQDAQTTWATGDYDAMMRQERLYGVGARLVRHAGLRPGEVVLDVACGTGNAAIPAAAAGAEVTGVDLTPQMLEVAQRRADDAGVEVRWTQGDAEDLPFDDGHFDVVLSAFGCMFAPRHEVVADELARVLRPGGRLAVCSWTPEGAIGDFFRTVGAHLPPMPDIVDPPPLWGDAQHVRELFEGTGIDLEFVRESWEIGHDSADDAVECYTTAFGPVVEARRLAEAEGRWPQLRQDMLALFDRLDVSGNQRVVFPAEYLVAIGRKTA
jgi:SAM-dependent methyltransferase